MNPSALLGVAVHRFFFSPNLVCNFLSRHGSTTIKSGLFRFVLKQGRTYYVGISANLENPGVR